MQRASSSALTSCDTALPSLEVSSTTSRRGWADSKSRLNADLARNGKAAAAAAAAAAVVVVEEEEKEEVAAVSGK